MITNGIAIIGSGSATPTISLDNLDLAQMVETSDEWISSRTGIHARRLAHPDLNLSQLATTAAQKALEQAEIAPQQVDLIILATSTPDDLFGSASQIQANLGAPQAVAFDLTAACSGFVFGLVTAAQFIQTGVYQTVLLIGADILSRWVDWSDRRTCVLFGDGAGAVVLQRASQNNLLGFELRNDGSQNACLNVPYQPQPKILVDDLTISQGRYQAISMNGKEVYRFAVKKSPRSD
jgi:3-oxoacyl-[acyl-carrier-protein] synthase-3